MRLTPSQKERFLEIGEAVQERKPVLLTGRSQGKTVLLHQALEVLGQRDERTGGITSTPRHPEDRTIEYFQRLTWPRSDKLTIHSVMRQVVGFMGENVKQYPHELAQQFDGLLREVADDHRIVTLAVDNAELLPAKAYTIMKALNEYRDTRKRRDVGLGLLIAGTHAMMKKMPNSFLLRCTPIQVGKITHEEIAQVVAELYPAQSHFFTAKALRHLAKCEDTLEIKATIDRCVTEQKRYRLKTIDFDLVEASYADAIAA